MNLIVLDPQQVKNELIYLDSRQSEHVNKILKSNIGDRLEVGMVNGKMGYAYVYKIQTTSVVLCKACFDKQSPKQIPLTLLLALPRPQMIKRILQTVACMGVKDLYLFHSEKVEKSFWQSPVLNESSIHEHLILGLEQAKATQLPNVIKKQSIKHFLEDELDLINSLGDTEEQLTKHRYIAHPGQYPTCPLFSINTAQQVPSLSISQTKSPTRSEAIKHYTIAIGPEGGFTEKELALFQAHDFEAIQFGERILKVETAITCLLSRFI